VPVAPAQPFFNSVLSPAIRCAADTGLLTSVVLAQWADETAYGTSRAWVFGHNPAGVSPGGKIASYPSPAAGFDAYVQTMNLHYYDPVRAAKVGGAVGQAYALGASPWAGGHYCAAGQRQGQSLVDIIESYDLAAYDGVETAIADPQPQPKPQEEPKMWCTDMASGKVLATDENGAMYAEPGISDLKVATLAEHPTFKAGATESAGANPCVGITSCVDPTGKWGWAFITKPTSGAGGFGPYDLYHFGRDGTPH
jgi:hypothetical protein